MSKYHNLMRGCVAACLMIYIYIKDERCIHGFIAKSLLKQYNLPYQEINIRKSQDGERDLMERLQAMDRDKRNKKGRRIIYPQIFDNDHYIGGASNLKSWLKNREHETNHGKKAKIA